MAKTRMVSLQYTFLFTREDNLWNSLYEFERDLADFFAAHGLEAEPILTIEGSSGNRMMMIKKIEIIPVLDNKPDNKKAAVPKAPPTPKLQKSENIVKQLVGKLEGGKK